MHEAKARAFAFQPLKVVAKAPVIVALCGQAAVAKRLHVVEQIAAAAAVVAVAGAVFVM